jgi:UDP-N-acetylglucosamine 3-dehydrogenase
MRILLVGLGRWGEKHLRVLRDLGAEVWVAERTLERQRWARAQGVAADRIVVDYREALGCAEAVDVVTPADCHAAIAVDALSTGRHCFVEKPLAKTLTEARAVTAAARAASRVLQVGHVFRFHPVTAALRRALAEDRIGQVRFATGRFAGFKRPRADVGVTGTDAIHFFDLFAHLFGRRATRVSAIRHDFLDRGLDDMGVTLVSYGDIDTSVEANYFVPDQQRECIIVGERGSLVADYGLGTVTLHLGEHRQTAGRWEAIDAGKEELPTVGAEPLHAELEAFLDACRGRIPNPVPAGEGEHALEVAEAAARAAALGCSVVV